MRKPANGQWQTPLERLPGLSRRPAHVIGLLSGTSADAIEAAICRITPADDRFAVELVRHSSHAHDPEVHACIAGAETLGVRRLTEMHCRLGRLFARAAQEAIAASGLKPEQIDLVGSHGQTVYHHSQVAGALRCTLQLGDGDCIAEATGLPVVSDFRARDIAAGGEGAPLTPIADWVLFRPTGPHGRRAILNIGGIANLTILDDSPANIRGFDTGPGNALLDRLARRLSGGQLTFDADGRLAAQGTVNPHLLDRLLAEDPFLHRPPPKSTGFEMYGDALLEELIRRHGQADVDLLATLTEFTARTVAGALMDHLSPEQQPGEIVVAGGGALNPDLMRRLASAIAPRVLTRSDELGVPVQAREAMSFAILAHRTVLGLPSSWPALTGARRPVVLGKLSFPAV
jgi:anhydro-N-acetylmuramic acid kinase